MVACLPFADAAGDADRLKCAGVVDVQIVSIDQGLRMTYLAPKRYGIAADRGAE